MAQIELYEKYLTYLQRQILLAFYQMLLISTVRYLRTVKLHPLHLFIDYLHFQGADPKVLDFKNSLHENS